MAHFTGKDIILFLESIDIVDYRITRSEVETVVPTPLGDRKEYREKYNIEINAFDRHVRITSNKQSDSDL